MFKKIGMVTALSAALIFGAGFDTANAESNHSFNYKFYYSINGENGSLTGQEAQAKIHNLINKLMENYHIDWKEANKNVTHKEQPVQKEEPAQPEKSEQQEQPVQKEESTQPEKTEQQEQPAQKEEPAQPEKTEQQEQPVKEPAKEQTEQAPAKNEATEQKAEETEKNQSQASELSQFEQEVVELTNQEREKNGLAPLKVDTELSKVAREKSRDMAASNYFSHNSPNYGSPFDMMKSFGITYRTAGENIAKGQRSPQEVVNAWMNSEGHRANILNSNFTHIGVGYVEQGNIWTQQFIGK
ncbi:CAP domain-containing protein [Ornithinibacillus sp. FSL M8-0202]|uniref:CAP domain-containing protein n=1 Tax=Ornithinibacillus sp. FSL M8-0202 TaxID=2921616 RepID=UPI0030CC968E